VCSCPPGQQRQYLEAALRAGKHAFNETNWIEDLVSLEPLARERGVVAVPSFTMRFSQGVMKLRETLVSADVGPIHAFVGHFGQHLALWHPWEDYREPYYAQRETGGAREMVLFELQWIAHLLGDVRRLTCAKGKLSDLDCDIDDVYEVIVELASGVLGSLQSDAISPTHYRWIRLVGTEAVVEWQDGTPIRVHRRETKAWTEVPVPKGTPAPGYHAAEEMYIEELGLFLAATRGEVEYGYAYADYQGLAEALVKAEAVVSDRRSPDGCTATDRLSTRGEQRS
jgi:predicted dehydrogenase